MIALPNFDTMEEGCKEDLGKHLEKSFTEVNRRLGNIENRIANVEGYRGIDDLKGRFDGLERRFDGLEKLIREKL